MNLLENDVKILREVAAKYMEIATLPAQKEKMNMWKAFNRLDNVRPMITIDQLPWNELNFDGSLTCKVVDPFLRNIEQNMRMAIFRWNNFPVDMVVEPYVKIPFAASNSGYGLEIVEETRETDADNSVVSHSFSNQLVEEDDLEKIKDMVITLDKEKSALWLEQAKYIFDGIAPVSQSGGIYLRLQIWDVLAELMGVEDIYYDIMDRPEFLHKIMEKMTKSALAGIQQANQLGLEDDNSNLCHCSYTYTDELLPDFGKGKGHSTKNSWNFSMAQLFTSASPSVTDEFEIQYISRLSAEYGMFYYGCCERLDDRLDIVQKLPNLKKISCSPWSDREKFAEKMDKRFIMSNKPSPSYIAGESVDFDIIKDDLTRTCEAAKNNGAQLELLLKDISTVKHQPQRLTEWANTAMRIVEKYS